MIRLKPLTVIAALSAASILFSPAVVAGTSKGPSSMTEASQKKSISAAFPYEKKTIAVKESAMAYVDEGAGPVVLFLHGNPTSSYLWRNIIPYVAGDHRAIAVDLIGMGDSGKPDIDYTFADHAAYLDAFIEALALKDITLVIHDWGSALGMRYARLHEDNVRAVALMEAAIPPAFPAPSLEAMGEPSTTMFRNLRTPGVGEDMVLGNNFFVETILPEFGVMRELSGAEMEAYRKPFPTWESRKPMLVWPRQIPIGGEPQDTAREIEANGAWFYAAETPKLYFYADPGILNPAPVTEYVKANAKNVETVFLGAGTHYLQEDHPHAIGEALAAWLADL